MKIDKDIKVGKKIFINGNSLLKGKLMIVVKIKKIKYLQEISWKDHAPTGLFPQPVSMFVGQTYAFVSNPSTTILSRLKKFFKSILENNISSDTI